MSKDDIIDFEEAFRVIKIDEFNYRGAYPLRLPITGARGIYGGHTTAQTLLVAIESSPLNFIPDAFHSYFIGAGDHRVPMEYKVDKIKEGANFLTRSIQATQKGKTKFTAIVSLVRKGYRKESKLDISIPYPSLSKKYPDPDKLKIVEHTTYIRNAYSPEFTDHKLCPEEDLLEPSERWITVWSGINNKSENNRSSFKDARFNMIGLADLSDSALLTTLARILHLNWNPTLEHPFEEFDKYKDARLLLNESFNMLQLFHYNGMSLDHHLYFHMDDYDVVDICKDWVTLTYQAKRCNNNRTLIRGCLFDKDGKCITTVMQEGLTYFHHGVPDQARL